MRRMNDEEKQKVFDKLRRVLRQGRGDDATEDVYGPPPVSPDATDGEADRRAIEAVYGPPTVFGDVTDEADDMRPAEGLYGPPPTMNPIPIGTEGRRNAQRLYGPMPVARPVADDDSEAGGNDMDDRTDTKAQALEVAMAFGYADIEYVMEWQGYAVFSPVESGGEEGLPEFILTTDTFARMTMGDEAFQIMDEMPEGRF